MSNQGPVTTTAWDRHNDSEAENWSRALSVCMSGRVRLSEGFLFFTELCAYVCFPFLLAFEKQAYDSSFFTSPAATALLTGSWLVVANLYT